ncbi:MULTISPECIES: alpha/beta hydrolase family protein [Actinomadura]|uniref:Alpha/beta hydrolase family protein n=1 Tax=Actinomadura yumaensis TaxID=111807 RepID=A0ABW2CDN3_9ACTN|nr:alpha/beta fold hydrolase [Actinomadura sp. J1-007]
MSVRSLWWAARTGGAPPFDTAHLKVYYPARPQGTDAERLTGVMPPDRSGAPYPVVLFCSGVNVAQEGYRAFATALASAGHAVVTFDRVGDLYGGQVGITPGVDVEAAGPEVYGSRPTCPALGAVLESLADIETLKGAIDLGRVALGGHSAGGTVALQSARFLPGVRACFAYGTHTMVATMLGWPAGTVLPAQVDGPVLLGVGTRDGVIAGSSDRYGPDTAADPVARTFHEALSGPDDLLAVLPGANHFTIADAPDPTAARAFLDLPAACDEAAARRAYTDLVIAFLRAHLRGEDLVPDADPELIHLQRRRVHREGASHGAPA